MGLYHSSVLGFKIGEEVEVIVPAANRPHNPPEMELEGKVLKVVSALYSDRTIDTEYQGETHNIPAAWLWRVKKS